MKIEKYKSSLFGLMMILITACSSDSYVDFGEQYQKVVYLVNSRDMLYTEEYMYGKEDNSMSFSAYCGGTEAIKNDLIVKLRRAPEALDSLNHIESLGNPLYVDKVLLPKSNYTFTDSTITIKAGKTYGVLKVPFVTTGLDPDKQYVLPLKIVSNSEGYDINKELNTLIYEVKMINGFSGDYSGSSTELPKTIRSVQPVLKAMSKNTVRMPIHTLSDEVTNLDTNFMLLTIADDSTTVTITPWGNAKVIDLGGSTYDKVKQSFELHYSFTNGGGTVYTITEKIVNLDAKTEEE
ncbi:MAG: DUF1735 domain-containing protein [Bacteroidota bacterium]|nr:DUF1735 domain-containing protein [Bacteroidota bacterium]